ncbi:unnamed protein product, partial [Sphacelaria rigidula]
MDQVTMLGHEEKISISERGYRRAGRGRGERHGNRIDDMSDAFFHGFLVLRKVTISCACVRDCVNFFTVTKNITRFRNPPSPLWIPKRQIRVHSTGVVAICFLFSSVFFGLFGRVRVLRE